MALRLVAIFMAFWLASAPAVQAQQLIQVEGRRVHMTVGSADVVNLERSAADVLVSNPNVVDVALPSPDRMYLMARSIGQADVFVFDSRGEVLARLNLQVSIDEAALQRTLLQVFPNERIEVQTVNQDVLMTGRISTPVVADQIRSIARRFVAEDTNLVDLTTVAGDSQVMLQVRVYEVRRSLLRELGFSNNLNLQGDDFGFGYQTNGTVGLTSPNPFLSAINPATGLVQPLQFVPPEFDLGDAPIPPGSTRPRTSGTQFNFIPGADSLIIGLDALEQDGQARLLAEPNLTAISGERATFHAGSETFLPTSNDNGDISLEPRDLGVKLTVEPVVLSPDRLRLRLATEVATLSDEGSITFANIVVSNRDVRRAETTIEIPSGGTMMIAGLLQSESSDGETGVPYGRDIPLLGRALRSESGQFLETELVILVTAVLVRPADEPLLATRHVAPARPEGLSAAPPQSLPTVTTITGGSDAPVPAAPAPAPVSGGLAAANGYLID